ncbi:MAG: hypothetical protein ACUVQ8_08510 [Nitrososphaeria archaeon]
MSSPLREWIATPLYLSGAWTLMITYQLFTQTAITTVTNEINYYWPSIAAWLNSRMDMIIFIYAFTWVFVLSSAIPSVVLAGKKSVILQFFVVLFLTLTAVFVKDALAIYVGINVENIYELVVFFQNPYFAVVYLAAPYLLMLEIDLLKSDTKKK